MQGQKTFFRTYYPELLLLLLFAGVSFVHDWQLESHLDIDSHRYLELGHRLVETGRFEHTGVSGELTPDYSRTPTFPVLIAAVLALTGKNIAVAIYLLLWLQRLVWGIAVCWLFPRIKSTRGRFRRWTLLGKVVLLFSPVVIHHSALLLTDLLYAAGLLAVIRFNRFALWRTGIGSAAVGLFHGALTLLRPVHLLVPFLVSVPYLKRRFAAAVVVVTCSVILPGAWVVRNYSSDGKIFLVALGGRALALHQETSIRKMVPEDSSAPYGPEFIAALHSTTENPITAAWILMRDHQLTEVQADATAKAVALESIRRRPLLYLQQTLQNFGRLFWSRIDGYNVARVLLPAAGERLWQTVGILNGVYGILVFAVLPLALFLKRFSVRVLLRTSSIAIVSVSVYLVLVPCFTTITYGRFLLPLLPIIGLIYCMADIGAQKKSLTRWQEKTKKKNFGES